MLLTRLSLATVAFLGLAAFQDSSNQYTIDFPEGWATEPPTEQGYTFATSPDDAELRCGAKSAAVPALASATQDELNAQLAAPVDAGFWANMLSADPAKLEVSESEVRDVNGAKMQVATLKIGAGFEGLPVDTISRWGVIVVPGKIVMGMCMATVEKFPPNKETFEKTATSLRAL
ncbi:MAG: hypothetical protein IT548_16975 [Alphaproteobacteria bacterium]|nr:hypothetical protein [Alphaproteobacteria bacterium]